MRGEERFWTIGRLVNLAILVVVHVTRDKDGEETTRIISARKGHRGSGDSLRKLTSRQRRKELDAIAAISDAQIDTSDIPERTEEQMKRAVRSQMYRPIKKPVTMRLDADVIAWLKQQGPG